MCFWQCHATSSVIPSGINGAERALKRAWVMAGHCMLDPRRVTLLGAKRMLELLAGLKVSHFLLVEYFCFVVFL